MVKVLTNFQALIKIPPVQHQGFKALQYFSLHVNLTWAQSIFKASALSYSPNTRWKICADLWNYFKIIILTIDNI